MYCPNRCYLYSVVSLFWILASFLQPVCAAQPNVLFLFSDDQRYDTIRALGNPHIHTPHLDRLSRQGMVFSRSYIMGGTQGAVCMPSRAMLLTGRTLFRAKDNLQGQTTWPEKFAQAGYRTFVSGKWHNGAPSLLRSFQSGKAVFLGGMGDPYQLPLQDISPEGRLTNQRLSGEHSVKLFADAAIEFLQRPRRDQPFLCYVAFNGPHDPRVAPPEHHQRYQDNPPPVPGNFMPQHPFNNGEMAIRDERLAPWPRTPEKVRLHLADYYSYITFMDEQIGRILEALRQSGQLDNTLIVFSSDNGLAMGSHGLLGKQNLYEHAIHEPLILAGPGVPRGRQSDALCYLLDVFPTLGEFCGVAAPDGSEGRSLAPVIRGETSSHRDSIFTAYRHLHRAVRDDRWKLIAYTQINKTQLFDLKNDPLEMNDLAGDPQSAGQIQRLTALLEDWQKQLGDPQPLTTPKPAPLNFDLSKASRVPRTNIVFVLADDLGWKDLGCYGSTFYETPNLDRLAATGMRFTEAYAACHVCSPTRASILTGKYPARLRLTDWLPGRPDRPDQKLKRPLLTQHLPLEEFTIAEALQEGGYRTAFMGKWHLGGTNYFPEHQGFDINIGGCEKGTPPSYFSPYRLPNLPDGPPGEYLTDRLTDEALHFIEKSRDKPFFLYLSHYAVHNPQRAKTNLIDKFKAKAAQLPPPAGPEFLPRNNRRVRQIQNQPVYAAMIQSLDESVGRIMDKLEELGLEKNTVIIFTSDNGGLSTSEGTPTSNLPLRMGKGWHYEGGVREPLLIRWPGVTPPGSLCRQPAISTDFYPTLLEVAGLPMRPQQYRDGVSLLPLLKGGVRSERPLFWHYPHYSNQGGAPGGAVRLGSYKLVEWFEDMRVELYNLDQDLGELHDLASAQPEKTAALRRQLHQWRHSVNAAMPTPNPDYQPAAEKK